MWIILKSLLNLLQYCFCLIFCFFGHKSHGILVPQQGIEPTPPALEGEVLTTGPPGKSLFLIFGNGTTIFYLLSLKTGNHLSDWFPSSQPHSQFQTIISIFWFYLQNTSWIWPLFYHHYHHLKPASSLAWSTKAASKWISHFLSCPQ